MTELKDWLNSINFTKQNLIQDDMSEIKKYPAFIINKCLSSHWDAILLSNAMNMNHHLDSDMQYSFYINILRKRKRFSPWIRKDKIADLDIVKQYYGYSNEKAMQALKVLSQEQINYLKKRLDIGGAT